MFSRNSSKYGTLNVPCNDVWYASSPERFGTKLAGMRLRTTTFALENWQRKGMWFTIGLPLYCLQIALMQLLRWSVWIFRIVGRVLSHQAWFASIDDKLHNLTTNPQTVFVLVLNEPCLRLSKNLRRRNKCFLMHSLTIKCNPLIDTLNVMSSVCLSCCTSATCMSPTGKVTCWIGGALFLSIRFGVTSATADVCRPTTNDDVMSAAAPLIPVSSNDS